MNSFDKPFIRHREAFNHFYAGKFSDLKQSQKNLSDLINSFSSEQFFLLDSPFLKNNRKEIGKVNNYIDRLSQEKDFLNQFEESIFMVIENSLGLEREYLLDELLNDETLSRLLYDDLKTMHVYDSFRLSMSLLLKKYLVCEPAKNEVFSGYLDDFSECPNTNKMLIPFIKYLIDLSQKYSIFYKDLFTLIDETNTKVFHSTKNTQKIFYRFEMLIRSYLGQIVIRSIINDCKGIMERRNRIIGKIYIYNEFINKQKKLLEYNLYN